MLGEEIGKLNGAMQTGKQFSSILLFFSGYCVISVKGFPLLTQILSFSTATTKPSHVTYTTQFHLSHQPLCTMRFILFYKLHLSFRNFFLPKMG
jgi:hypothetical protein